MSIETEREAAAKSLYGELTKDGYPHSWFRGIGTPKGTELRQVFVYVKLNRDLKRLPKEWEGFEVVGTVIGDISL